MAEAKKKPATKKKTSAKAGQHYIGLGRRKSSVARVKLETGAGKIEVNGKDWLKYFTVPAHRENIKQPLAATGMQKKIDINIRTRGGGKQAQSNASRLGIARAILKMDPEQRAALKTAGYLTRDARKKERKKYGLKGARRAPQFSKR